VGTTRYRKFFRDIRATAPEHCTRIPLNPKPIPAQGPFPQRNRITPNQTYKIR
jgi:hypothetical protein